MNWDIFAGTWKQIRGKEQAWRNGLTHNPGGVLAGERLEEVGKIQQRYGIRKHEAEQQGRQFSDHIKNGGQ